jgi:hypothetical protein
MLETLPEDHVMADPLVPAGPKMMSGFEVRAESPTQFSTVPEFASTVLPPSQVNVAAVTVRVEARRALATKVGRNLGFTGFEMMKERVSENLKNRFVSSSRIHGMSFGKSRHALRGFFMWGHRIEMCRWLVGRDIEVGRGFKNPSRCGRQDQADGYTRGYPSGYDGVTDQQ